MSKVFTITEGLENMGALKTGGQGSVYKAKRTGTIITAVKLLPTPIHSEDPSDKNYRDFNNEVEKLKKVNEEPNPNIVKILSSGVSETGSFPFIEMDFIEGPDLEESLKPPHDPIFSIKEAIKVAEHLAHALAHCHKVDVKHGDIKSNNVKFNIHTGNYVLLDFGLAVMSDEQRRTSLRHAGAIEFMAPEQANGNTLFETDVYSFGVILFELLAGRVPFPLQDRSETSRNLVMVAHMETAPPDLLSLREEHIPSTWPEDKKDHEMKVPQWLIDMIYKCLQKDPAMRYANGMDLYDAILKNSVLTTIADDGSEQSIAILREEIRNLRKENEELKRSLQDTPQTFVPNRERISAPPPPIARKKKSSGVGIIGIIAATLLAVAALFFFLNRSSSSNTPPDNTEPVSSVTTQPLGKYKVSAARAYFYSEPDRSTKREAYLIPSEDIVVASKEQGEFIYTVFTNSRGQTSKGWILKKDLKRVEGTNKNTQDQIRMSEAQISSQLAQARKLQSKNNTEEAIAIYKSLIPLNVPEAMFQYGDLGLRNINSAIDCQEAISMITAASDQGYTPAKRRLGSLYLFAGNRNWIEQQGYGRCEYTQSEEKGSQLLTDAALEGDKEAQNLLDEYNRNKDAGQQ
jgi:eukaryotic-like serine/threonine-protein kinase